MNEEKEINNYDYEVCLTTIHEDDNLNTKMFRYFNTLEEATQAFELLSTFGSHDNIQLTLENAEENKIIKTINIFLEDED